MELNTNFPGHVYIDTCEDAFFFLASHYSGTTEVDDDSDWYGEQRKYLDKSVNNMRFHFFKVSEEEMEEGVASHWESGGKYAVKAEEVSIVRVNDLPFNMNLNHTCM